jgi:hypothetical protein
MIRAAAVLFFVLAAVPGSGAEVGPGGDWCAAIQALHPGDELVLGPGAYAGPCTIRRGGTPTDPIVVRARDPGRPPQIVYAGDTDNVLNVRAGHVTVRGLEFGPTARDIDAIRIHSGDGITIEDCRFTGLGGIAVVVNASVDRLTVRRNTIVRSNATAMYFGCHDGVSCAASDVVVERNYIHGVEAPDPAIGYGIQVKLNTTAIVRDNVVVDTKGPGIMAYGATDPARRTLVEGNFVARSRTSSAIVIGGGPAIVRNNITVTSAEAGIGVEDYGRRRLLQGIALAHNTVYDNARGGIVIPESAGLDVTVVNNAVHARPGFAPLPSPRLGLSATTNVDCATRICFLAPVIFDFSPVPGGPLLARGSIRVEAWAPRSDYFGRARAMPSTVGAIEISGEPITLRMKPAP